MRTNNTKYLLGALIAAIVLMMVGCKNQQTKEVVSFYKDGKPKMEQVYSKSNGTKVIVKEIQYYENGNIKMEGELKEGFRNGKWVFWFEHGSIWSEGFFTDGIRTGETKVYHENGKLFYEGVYHEGQKHDTWNFYNEQGHLVNQVLFDQGKFVKQTSPNN